MSQQLCPQASVKLIAEPWDLGTGGYQVGKFPVTWTERNGKYRDALRKFWKGDMGLHAEIATRLGGSADLYERTGRSPFASINFITAHDGFTLHARQLPWQAQRGQIGMFLPGNAPEIRDRSGQPVRDDDFLLLLNSHHETVAFRIPEDLDPELWGVACDRSKPDLAQGNERPGPDGKVALTARSFLLLRRPRQEE